MPEPLPAVPTAPDGCAAPPLAPAAPPGRSSRPRTRRVRRSDRLLEALRQRILDGTWPAGTRLPTRRALEASLGVSSITLQRALDQLAEHGFVSAAGRAGTSVTARPPHLHRVALVQCWVDGPQGPGGHWSSLLRAALRQRAAAVAQGETIEVFEGIDPGYAERPDWRRLVAMVRARSLAGIIFAAQPWRLIDTPLLADDGIPRVALMSSGFEHGCSALRYDVGGFVTRALDHLAASGRRRIAVIGGYHPGDEAMAGLERALAERGLWNPAWWRFFIDPHGAATARSLAHLLLRRDGRELPDGLLVWDDTLAEAVLAGVADAGGIPPGGLEIVVHANLPGRLDAPVPCRRLGYDSAACIDLALGLLRDRRAGRAVPPVVEVPAVFADGPPPAP